MSGIAIRFVTEPAGLVSGRPLPAEPYACLMPLEDEPGHCVTCGHETREVIVGSWWAHAHGGKARDPFAA